MALSVKKVPALISMVKSVRLRFGTQPEFMGRQPLLLWI